MKKSLIYLSLTTLLWVGLTNCSHNNNEPEDNTSHCDDPAAVVGMWKPTQIFNHGTDVTPLISNALPCVLETTLTLNADESCSLTNTETACAGIVPQYPNGTFCLKDTILTAYSGNDSIALTTRNGQLRMSLQVPSYGNVDIILTKQR